MAQATKSSPPSPPVNVSALLAPLLIPLLAVFTALVIGAFFIWITGKDWVTAYIGLWEGSFGTPSAIINSVIRSTPFVITGLAVALGFKTGVFNVGAEGQIYAGALLAVLVGYNFQGLPSFIHIPLAIAAGALGGFLYGAIPGYLKAATGAHEVINTIMLNYIALRLSEWLIKSKTPYIMGDPADTSGARTRFIAESAHLPQIGTTGLHAGILVAIILVFAVNWLLYRTTIGFELRTVGINPSAAKYAGINVPRTIVLGMGLSGMLAGIAGAGEVLGREYALKADFFAGLGFDAIAVALLARSSPVAIIFSGLLWGGLLTGARLMQVRAELSIDLIKIVQALIILFIAADQIVRWIYRIRAQKPGEETIFSRGWGA